MATIGAKSIPMSMIAFSPTWCVADESGFELGDDEAADALEVAADVAEAALDMLDAEDADADAEDEEDIMLELADDIIEEVEEGIEELALLEGFSALR